MALFPAIAGFKSINAVTISGAGATAGGWMQIRSFPRFSFQASWTGTLAGTFTWEMTNSPADGGGSAPPAAAAVTTLTVPSTFTAGDPAGSAGNFTFMFSNIGMAWIRPKLTWISGSGVLTVTAAGNGA